MQRGYTISAQGMELAEVTLADIITFSRQRQGEVAKLTMADHNKKTKVDMASDIQAALSQMEEKLCISSGQFHILYEPTKAHHTRKGAGPQRPKFFTPKISFVLFDLQRPNLSS